MSNIHGARFLISDKVTVFRWLILNYRFSGVHMYRFPWNLAKAITDHHFIDHWNMPPNDDSYVWVIRRVVRRLKNGRDRLISIKMKFQDLFLMMLGLWILIWGPIANTLEDLRQFFKNSTYYPPWENALGSKNDY